MKKFFVLLMVMCGLILSGCATEQLSKEKEIKNTPQNSDLIDIKVNYSDVYQITDKDKKLMEIYPRRYIYKVFKNGKNTFVTPTYDYLKMKRSGPGWSVVVEEQISGKFKIEGKNSKGKQLNNVCNTIQQCFSMI